MSDARYTELRRILEDAYCQATQGKGNDRHASDELPWEAQHALRIARMVGPGFLSGQAIKKIIESQRAPSPRDELLGAIVYLAALVRYGEMWE